MARRRAGGAGGSPWAGSPAASRRAVVGLALCALLAACAGGGSGVETGRGGETGTETGVGPGPTSPGAASARAAALDAVAGAPVDYQLGGAYLPPAGVRVVVRDVTQPPAGVGYDLCYVNAFQTQPGDRDRWLRELPDLVLREESGALVVDPGWPDELLLDTSTAEKRRAIAEEIGAQIDACADQGYDAVEPDNLDSATRSQGLLTMEDNLALAELLVARAHDRGLAIAQKNTVELGARGPETGFDLVVAEDCAVYDECGDYLDVYGRRVVEIEYSDSPDAATLLERSCRAHGRGPDAVSVVLRDRDLSLPGDPGYVFASC